MKKLQGKAKVILTVALVLLAVLAIAGRMKKYYETGNFTKDKWDGKIVLTEVGKWSETVSWECYQNFHAEQISGSAETFEVRDALHPERTRAFASGAKDISLGTNTFDIQLRILSGPKELPVVYGYTKKVTLP